MSFWPPPSDTQPPELMPRASAEAVAKVIGATEGGLSGSEIGRVLAALGLPDPAPATTKWRRIADALDAAPDGSIERLVEATMDPVRYVGDPRKFERRRSDLNEVLVMFGRHVGEDGRLTAVAPASTVNQAAARAGHLRAEMRRRAVHPELVAFCSDEVLVKDSFHAMLEAVKSLCDRMRRMTGEQSDGAALVNAVLSLGADKRPVIQLNALQDESDVSEQKGFQKLFEGLFGSFRNPTAHAPRIRKDVTDDDLLDLLSFLSLCHRRLDSATLNVPAD